MDHSVDRRDFLKTIGLGAGAMALPSILPARAHAKPRTNVIFLLTDDQRYGSIGIMGHQWVRTPNLDSVVRSGVRFSNAYIAEPTCSPSRAALFTGMHERVNGVGFTSSYRLNEQQWSKTYPALLRAHGYHTGFIGKFGVEYYTFRGRAAEKFDFWRGHDGWARFFPKAARNCAIYKDSREDIITPIMGESIQRFLDAAPKDRPFCLSVSFSVPHGSQARSMHDAAMKLPASENPKLAGHPVYGGQYRDIGVAVPPDTATDPYRYIPKAILDQDRGRSKTYSYNYDRETCKEHHIRYHQMITGLDGAIGDMMDALKRHAMLQDTVIIFTSDNGLLMGEYGMGGKALLYDLASKVPCFIFDPRLSPDLRGRTVESLVSSLDITATILDYAGLAAPEEMEGRSLRPLVHDEPVEWRKELFLENLYTGRDTPFSEGIRRGKWKYIRMFDGKTRYTEQDVDFAGREPGFEQLFDLDGDPEEKSNLIDRFEGTALLDDLRRTCRRESDLLNHRRERYMSKHQTTRR